MPSSQDSPTPDQASRLRQLAAPTPATPLGSPETPVAKPTVSTDHATQPVAAPRLASPSATGDGQPRVVLISELPGLCDAYALSWHLARQMHTEQDRSLVVDLSPAASRLPLELDKTKGQGTTSRQRFAPLWIESLHSRRLAPWRTADPSAVGVVAQPAGPFPATDQLPRICEQLLRTLSRPGRGQAENCFAWQNLLLLSECQGIPLDSSCWQAADEIILLVPELLGASEHLQAMLAARLPRPAPAQRLFVLWERATWRGTWLPSSRPLRRLPPVAEQELGWALGSATHFRLQRSRRDSYSRLGALQADRMLARASHQLAQELGRISIPSAPFVGGRTRQAG